MAYRKRKRATKKRIAISSLLLAAAMIYSFIQGVSPEQNTVMDTQADGESLVVSYIDVGQGDATLIRKGDFHMLIDSGNNEAGSTVVDYLQKQKINQLDILVGTHPDSDHIGGMDDVLEEIDVDTVYMPETTKDTKTYQEVEEALGENGLTAEMPEIGKQYTYDENVAIRFLSPQKEYDDANNNSLVVQLAYGKNRFLFMGDAEEEAEEDIIEQSYDLECDVLKAGHHGSYTATSDRFLQAANPTYAVISCGAGNSYGHPHAAVLSRLEDEDVQIYRTDTMGTIRVISDGENITIKTEKGS